MSLVITSPKVHDGGTLHSHGDRERRHDTARDSCRPADDPANLDPTWSSSGLSIDALADRVAGEAGRINAATCAWLGLVAEADRRTAWQGFTSTGSWLSWLCGIAPGTAREHVRVARALEGMSLVRAAFASGRMTYSQVRALTRVSGVIAEGTLVDLASWATGAQLERLLRALTRATRADEERAIAERRARWWIDEEGCLVIRARLAGPDAALVMAALDHARDAAREGGGRHVGEDGVVDSGGAGEGVPDTREMPDTRDIAVTEDPAVRAADALVTLARTYAEGSHHKSKAGPLSTDPVQVHVIVEAEELAAALRPAVGPAPSASGDPDVPAGTHDPDVPAGTRPMPPRIEPTGVPISQELLLALTCHAPIHVLSRFADGSLVDLGRTRRAPSRAIARAVLQRHGGTCAYPACHARRYLHLHHVVHWAHGGATSVANLVPLCGRHHRALHTGAFRIELTPAPRITLADGTPVPPLGIHRTGIPSTGGIPLAHDSTWAGADQAGRTVTSTPGRDTRRLDLGYAASVLLERHSPRPPAVPWPT